MTRRTLAVSLLGAALMAEPARVRPVEDLNASLQQAIIAGDTARMKMLLEQGADANSKDAEGTPALMNAALYGSAAHMKLLLDRGADVNARNGLDSTALIWAAGDAVKAAMLLEKGADVNAQSRLGRTPLMAAAGVAGNAVTVKAMLAKGARVDVKDEIAPIPVVPAGGGKGTALIDAARSGDEESIRALLAAGADVNAKDARGGTALSEAVMYSRRDLVRLLLTSGADASIRVTVLQFPLLSLAGMRGDAAVAKMLIDAKSPVNASDMGGATPLMFAATIESGDSAMVDLLIKAGADVNAKSKSGETALDWGAKRGETDIVKRLREAGAVGGSGAPAPATAERMGPASANEAITKAFEALGKSAPVAFKAGGCASCHNHQLPMAAMGTAARKGIAVDTKQADSMTNMTLSMLKPMTPALLEGSDMPPDIAITGGYMLEALSQQHYPSNRITAALVHKLLMGQLEDGHWVGWGPRAPMEAGDIQATAMTIRALRAYPIPGRQTEINMRIAKARQWLIRSNPTTTEEYIMRLEGLRESGASPSMVADAAQRLAMLQRKDGGWAQLPYLESDAYATGKAMVALIRAQSKYGDRKAADRFLRTTQFADGTWHVKTRSYPLQPLKDSGFSHGRDQWISAAATSWAAQALAMNMR